MTAHPDRLQGWTYDELVREGLALIPGHAPAWTNHNASDPGITLVELLAYFTEVLVYRLGRVTPRAKLQFLRLLKGPQWQGWRTLASAKAIDDELDAAVRALGRADCAVTAADFERLAIEAARPHLGPDDAVRAFCVPCPAAKRGHVTVVLLPRRELERGALDRLCTRVRDTLLAHCLLTTRLHVVGPTHLHVAIGCRLALRAGAVWREVLDAIDANLERRLGPWGEKPATPGAPLPLGSVVEVIDGTAGVDFVEDVMLSHMSAQHENLFDVTSRVGILIATHSTVGVDSRLGILPGLGVHRLRRDDAGRLTAVALHPGELLHLRLAREAVLPVGGLA